MAARKPKAVDIQPLSLKFYDDWSTARDESKSVAADLGAIVKEAVDALDVSKWAFKSVAELRRMDPQKSSARIRDFNRLVREWGLDAQLDFVDQLEGEDELEPVA